MFQTRVLLTMNYEPAATSPVVLGWWVALWLPCGAARVAAAWSHPKYSSTGLIEKCSHVNCKMHYFEGEVDTHIFLNLWACGAWLGCSLAGCCLESPKVLLHRIGLDLLKFINVRIRFYHKVDSLNFTKRFEQYESSPLSTKPPCPETPYHARVALSVV